MFGEGLEVGFGGRVMVTVRLEGKSAWVGVLVGMVDVCFFSFLLAFTSFNW